MDKLIYGKSNLKRVVGLEINNDKAEIALAYKVNNSWSVDLLAQHDWTGGNQVGLISKLTW